MKKLNKIYLLTKIALANAMAQKDKGLEGIVVTLLIVVVAVIACVFFKNATGNTMNNIINKADSLINSTVFTAF